MYTSSSKVQNVCMEVSVHLDSLMELMSLTESDVRFAGMVAVIYLTTLDEQEVAVLLLLHHLYRHWRHFRQRWLQALVRVQVVLQVFRTKQTCTQIELVEYLQELLDFNCQSINVQSKE